MKRVAIIAAVIILALLLLMAGVREITASIKNRQVEVGGVLVPIQVSETTGARFLRTHRFESQYYPRIEYQFKGDFVFTVTDEIVDEGLLWRKVRVTNYFDKLIGYKIDELKTVLYKYGLGNGMYGDEETIQQETLRYGYLYTSDSQALPKDGIPFYRYTFYTTDPEKEEDIRACAQEMYDVLKDYFIKNPIDAMKYDWIVDMGCVTQAEDGTLSVEYKSILVLPMYN